MKRIPIIGFISLAVLACQAITEVATPAAESLNTPSVITEDNTINIMSPSNSDIVFFSAVDSEIYTMDQDGNNLRKLTNSSLMLPPSTPKWSPDKNKSLLSSLQTMGIPSYI